MIKIQVITNWECYSQYGNEAIELVAVNSSYQGLHHFEGDCPPLDADTLAYLIHNVHIFNKESHLTDYLLKSFPAGCNEVTISRKQIQILLDWCLKLQGDEYAPCYVDKWCVKTNQKVIISLQCALRKFNDEWYDGERHQWILKKIK